MFLGDIPAVSFEKNPAENFKLPHSFKSDFATLHYRVISWLK